MKFFTSNHITPQEFSALRLNETFEVPNETDWRIRGAVNDVVDQSKDGICGSCYSFATTATIESHHFIRTGNLLKLSEQELVDCSNNWGCKGGNDLELFTYLIENGIGPDENYPYESKQGTCRKEKASKNRVNVYGYADFSGREKLKKVVAELGPAKVMVNARAKSFRFYEKGIYNDPESNGTETNHVVVVVGFGHDNETGMDYWIVRNSRSKAWGENGYIRIAMNSEMFEPSQLITVPLMDEEDAENNSTIRFWVLDLILLAILSTCCSCYFLCYLCARKCVKTCF